MSHLQKKLTLYGLTMIAVGSCIGSGIFVTPAQIAGAVPNASLVLAVWALGGVIALSGALTFSELGGMFPGSGGVYIYLKEAYGEMVGFLYFGGAFVFPRAFRPDYHLCHLPRYCFYGTGRRGYFCIAPQTKGHRAAGSGLGLPCRSAGFCAHIGCFCAEYVAGAA